jgi:D-alanyl-D-alanine carboxypeptidase (penicillin-binding protein 5/6)
MEYTGFRAYPVRAVLKQTERRGPEKHFRFFILLLLSVCWLLPVNSYAENILSRAAVVMDASTGRLLYAKNPLLERPPASTTKIMTSIIAVEHTSLSEKATISWNASHVQPHKAGFKEGDQVTAEQLLYAALLGSANDATVALSEMIAGSEESFVTLMNSKAIDIGAENTKYANSNGLPGDIQYTTAFDLAKIMRYALRHQILKDIIGTRVTDITTENGDSIFLKNTNRLLWSGDDIVGGKTGYTRKAMHCFVCVAERDNQAVIVALLGSPSRDTLWKESEMLISRGFAMIQDNGEPFIYTTDAASDFAGISKKKLKAGKKLANKTRLSAKKKSSSKLLAKKKGKTYLKSRHSRQKNFKLADKRKGVRGKG